MGRRGPPPKPTALRALEGDRSHRPRNRAEPKPPVRLTIYAPKELDKIARAEWRRIMPLLAALGLLTELDRTALTAYCLAYSALVQAAVQCSRDGILLQRRTKDGPPGPIAESPALRVFAKMSHLVAVWCGRFGLTPSDRCRMVAPGARDVEDDPIAGMLRDNGGRAPRAAADGDPSYEAIIHDLQEIIAEDGPAHGGTDTGSDDGQ